MEKKVRAGSVVYASGLELTEQIVAATSNAGFAAGALLVVDAWTASNNNISSVYAIPPGGGTPALLASLPSGSDAFGDMGRQLNGTGSTEPSFTRFVHDASRTKVSFKPRNIPNRSTAKTEYSEHVGLYRHRITFWESGRPYT